MGMFSTSSAVVTEDTGLKNPDELTGYFIVDEVSRMSDEDRKAFLESEECKILQERNMLKKKTLVRLNKNDDLTRRKKMAAFQIAKDNHWKEWDLLVKNRIKERALIAKIVQKAGMKAEKAAKVQQKNYLSGKGPLGIFKNTDARKGK